jgi:hypothetical protein
MTFCAGCGSQMAAGVRFCTRCGAATAEAAATVEAAMAPVQSVAYAPPIERSKSNSKLIIGGGILVAALVAAAGTYTLSRQSGAVQADNAVAVEEQIVAGDDGIAKPVPAVSASERVEKFVASDANIRNRPTALGKSRVIAKLLRGSRLSGALQPGIDKRTRWFRLADGRGYVSAVNLSDVPPPKLAQSYNGKRWYPGGAIAIRALPDTASAVVSTTREGAPLIVSGITDSNFAEVKLPNGGVGFVPADQVDVSADAANGVEAAASAAVAVGAEAAAAPYVQMTCTVIDKTGTQLRIRTAPYGRVIGGLNYGAKVRVLSERSDASGDVWAEVQTSVRRAPHGWVFRQYISC